jgi:hypothetical protein
MQVRPVAPLPVVERIESDLVFPKPPSSLLSDKMFLGLSVVPVLDVAKTKARA